MPVTINNRHNRRDVDQVVFADYIARNVGAQLVPAIRAMVRPVSGHPVGALGQRSEMALVARPGTARSRLRAFSFLSAEGGLEDVREVVAGR